MCYAFFAVRYSKDHKEVSRQKIIEVASKEFRRRGIAGIGVGDLMKGAGLTQGAFYGHFASKEELVRDALHQSTSNGPVGCLGLQGRSLKEIIDIYLAVEH